MCAAAIQSSERSSERGPSLNSRVQADEAKSQLRQAAEACADWLILIDRNFHVVFANRSCDDRNAHELRGLNVADLLPAPYRERAMQCLSGVVRIGAPDR